jgi:hypothetical protein
MTEAQASPVSREACASSAHILHSSFCLPHSPTGTPIDSLPVMSLQHLTLGERIVMASRVAAAEHLRQDADGAGINVRRLQREMEVVRRQNPVPETLGAAMVDSFRQDMFRQPSAGSTPGGDDRRAA